MAHPFTKALFDFKNYERQILWMHEKFLASSTRGQLPTQEGVEFENIARSPRSFAKAMVEDIKAGRYKTDPARHVTILTKGKERILYKYKITDMILQGVIARILIDSLEGKFSNNLHSYRKGKNYFKAIRSFSKYCRAHFKRNVDPRTKGFYVLRRDVASYTDNIPVGVDSPLWPILKKEINFPENPTNEDLVSWNYLEKVIRTDVILPGASKAITQQMGVPTGSPISTVVYNLYLINVDRNLDSLELGFYARYGDDLMMADPSLEKINKANDIFKDTLKTYHLGSSPKKEHSYFFTIAGRKPTETGAHESGFGGCDRVEFLGCDIMARGEISLDRDKERTLTKNLQKRIRVGLVNEPLGTDANTIQARLEIAIDIVNKALDPESKLCQKTAPALRYLITDRHCLKRLDYIIARLIIKHTLGHSSVKGFRSISMKNMRQKGLMSLVAQRNLVGRKSQETTGYRKKISKVLKKKY